MLQIVCLNTQLFCQRFKIKITIENNYLHKLIAYCNLTAFDRHIFLVVYNHIGGYIQPQIWCLQDKHTA